jgi:hypothetical protein
MEWRHTSSPSKMKFKQTTSPRNIMCRLFWDRKGVLLVDFLPQGSTINADVYCDSLTKFLHAIQSKRHGKLSWGVMMIHDSAHPHPAAATQNLITTFSWERFDHSLYSTGLGQVIFICFCILKLSLLAGGSILTMRSKKPLPNALRCRQHHCTMKGYNDWCHAMTSASTIVETMSKSSVQYGHEMAIYMVCNIFLFFS